jgi:uncharacterized integral membrane protein
MVKMILLLLFSLALASFAIENNVPVQIRFLFWKSQGLSLALVILLSAAVGAILALVAGFPTHWRRHRRLRKVERELEELRDSTTTHT